MNIERVRKVKRSKAFTRIDFCVVVALIVSVAACAAFVFRTPSATVTVSAPGYEREFSLGDDRVIKLEHLTVRIKDGKVWVTDSTCNDHTCEHTGKISRAGQRIVCLPHGVVIAINGDSDLQWELGR